MGFVSLSEGEETRALSLLCEDTARRWPSANEEEGPHPKTKRAMRNECLSLGHPVAGILSEQPAALCGQRRSLQPTVHPLRFFVSRTIPAARLQVPLGERPQDLRCKKGRRQDYLFWEVAVSNRKVTLQRMSKAGQGHPHTCYVRTVPGNLRGKGSARKPQTVTTETLTAMKKRYIHKHLLLSATPPPNFLYVLTRPATPTHSRLQVGAQACRTLGLSLFIRMTTFIISTN